MNCYDFTQIDYIVIPETKNVPIAIFCFHSIYFNKNRNLLSKSVMESAQWHHTLIIIQCMMFHLKYIESNLYRIFFAPMLLLILVNDWKFYWNRNLYYLQISFDILTLRKARWRWWMTDFLKQRCISWIVCPIVNVNLKIDVHQNPTRVTAPLRIREQRLHNIMMARRISSLSHPITMFSILCLLSKGKVPWKSWRKMTCEDGGKGGSNSIIAFLINWLWFASKCSLGW